MGGDLMRAFFSIPLFLAGIVIAGFAVQVLPGQNAAPSPVAKLPQSDLIPGAPAPSDKAMDFPLSQLTAAFKDMDAKQLQSLRILEGGKHNINIRRLTGPERSLKHPAITDVWVVLEGSGTLVTGGELVNATKDSRGEESGSAIVGGFEREIKTGDVIFIPPGVPHAVKETRQITYLNIRYDVK
jgi:mannose-6-phosphate isomerase-like protein (cupin superfamily)